MKTLLHPTYFPDLLSFAAMVQNQVVWEVEDNYQKQTYRNRCYICHDRGRHLLNIPIQHIGNKLGRQKYKSVKIENEYPWQRQHWRTLQTAYRASPFFEYYEDDLAPLFEKAQVFLMDFNLKTIEAVCDCLQITMPTDQTELYEPKNIQYSDARILVNSKKKFKVEQTQYTQVFGNRHGFIKNSSILDLLFNEGPNSIAYLKNQTTPDFND